MVRFAANLSFLFGEAPFLDRFERAATAGFKGVEYLFPYEFDAAEIARRLRAHGLDQVLFNAPPGDWAAGDRGLAALPSRTDEFRASIERALDYAVATCCPRVHVMAGIAAAGDPEARRTYLANLKYAAARFAEHDVTLLIEPLNPRDMPGYFLADFDVAAGIVRELGLGNVRLQFDIYHRQILHGDVTAGLRALAALIGHIQIAGVPDRHEPTDGELSLPWIIGAIEAAGFDGWIGCEYRPRRSTEEGLGWLEGYRRLL
jgi:hydroxypyruvate isomerase